MNHESLLKEIKNILNYVKEILPPEKLLKECHRLSEKSDFLSHSVIGFSQKNHPIDLFTFGKERPVALLYGFPDPGEAVGGTSILALIKNLVSGNSPFSSWKVKWLFIPCLNSDDQPLEGKKLKPVMRNPKIKEVDWCLNNPRPETKALVKLAREYKPIFSFPLHDEYHSKKEILPYVITSKELDKQLCDQIRTCFRHFNTSLNPSHKHPKMGKGFIEMKSTKNYKNSTFSILNKFGTVIICEVSQLKNLTPAKLVGFQLSVGMTVLNNITLSK